MLSRIHIPAGRSIARDPTRDAAQPSLALRPGRTDPTKRGERAGVRGRLRPS
jgi:hypothetical protein